jgi:co-chaperonin GroES (HSP10)
MNSAALKIPSVTYTQEELSEAFPEVESGFEPFGSRLIVQLRSPKTKSKGGIHFITDTQDTELWNTQIGKVRALGPLAFKNREKIETWPEGEWCSVGEYVRIPKWNQDKWIVEHGDKQVLFMLINDLDLLAKKIGNPLEVKAYI